jgi:predicted metal-dependent hydrolase
MNRFCNPFCSAGWLPTLVGLHFSSDLLSPDPELWEYVIVHELLHFSVPNHGRLWKALMRAHLGDWEKAAKRLESHAEGHTQP